MRVLQNYRFLVGTKIPFDQWPGLIEQFLREQNLRHHSFHYYLKSYDSAPGYRSVLDGSKCDTCEAPVFACRHCRKEAESYLRKGTACERAARENPFLGEIQTLETRYLPIQLLHNFQEESNRAKEPFYAILPKIYRRYGFAETYLIYREIDFFSRRLPTPAPEIAAPDFIYRGSGIILNRSCISRDNEIRLTVQFDDPGEVSNAAVYAGALGALLPGIRQQSFTEIVMDKAEEATYQMLNHQSLPLIAQAKEFFTAHMPDEKGNNDPAAPVSVASWLKKMGKRYGYAYKGCQHYIYFMEKKLTNGHYVCLEFVSGPDDPASDPFVSLWGLGFRHEIWMDSFAPQNSRDADFYFTRLFETLVKAETSVFPAILERYPTTPDWFVPTH